MQITAEQIYAIARRCAKMGTGNAMRDDERKAGRTVVMPGDVPWLPVEDWLEDIVVCLDGRRVRLIAIIARRPHTGAFSRLIDAIISAGLLPVVVEPMGNMTAILKGWEWNKRIVGSTFEDTAEEWFPTGKWMRQREAKNAKA